MNSQPKEIVEQPSSPHGSESGSKPELESESESNKSKSVYPHGSESASKSESKKSKSNTVKDLSPTPASVPTQQDPGVNFIGSELGSESKKSNSGSVKDPSLIPSSEPTQQDPADDSNDSAFPKKKSNDSDLPDYMGYRPSKRAREEGWPYLDEIDGDYARPYNGKKDVRDKDDPKFVEDKEESDKEESDDDTQRNPVKWNPLKRNPVNSFYPYLLKPWLRRDWPYRK